MIKPKVCRLRTSNLVGGRLEHALSISTLPWSAIKACELGYCSRAGIYPIGRTRRPQACFRHTYIHAYIQRLLTSRPIYYNVKDTY